MPRLNNSCCMWYLWKPIFPYFVFCHFSLCVCVQEACVNACWVYSVKTVYNVVSSLRYLTYFLRKMWGCMCWTGPFKFRWSRRYIQNSSYYLHQIGSINISHCCHIFPWLCVWSCCTIICCWFHIYIWVRSRNCGCLVTWFCYQLIAKPGNKTVAVSWPDPYIPGKL